MAGKLRLITDLYGQTLTDISRNPNTNQEAYVITFDNICKWGNKNNA